ELAREWMRACRYAEPRLGSKRDSSRIFSVSQQPTQFNSSYNHVVLLYYITDRKSFGGNEADQRAALLRCVAKAARAGLDYIQLREKDLNPADAELLARQARHLVRENSADTKFLISTHAEIALSVGADGVHLPAKASPVASVREYWLRESGHEPVIGVSVHTMSEVQQAQLAGARFAVLAPIFEKVAPHAIG